MLPADGSTPVDLTAIVTDAESGVAIEGKTVAFAVSDPPTACGIEVTRAMTDASGVAVARLLLNGNATERDVTVLASVDQKTPAELVIQVAARATERRGREQQPRRADGPARHRQPDRGPEGAAVVSQALCGDRHRQRRHPEGERDGAGDAARPRATTSATGRPERGGRLVAGPPGAGRRSRARTSPTSASAMRARTSTTTRC